MKMKTGLEKQIYLPEIFTITLMALDSILKRASFKDTILFKEHNQEYKFDQMLFTSGICFNLFSEYGIGKKLEPMLEDLFRFQELDAEQYQDNIYYKEIVNLVPDICKLVRTDDYEKQSTWTYQYAIRNLNKVDPLSRERLERLSSLFKFIVETDNTFECTCKNSDSSDNHLPDEYPEEYPEDDEYQIEEEYVEGYHNQETESSEHRKDSEHSQHRREEYEDHLGASKKKIKLDLCPCNFCKEFKKYHIERTETSSKIILDVLRSIERKVTI